MSSVVYGMPMAAYAAGGVSVQLPLYRIPDEIVREIENNRDRDMKVNMK
jgi:chemotaxis response regulator CheB